MNTLIKQAKQFRSCLNHHRSLSSQITFSGIQPTSVPHIGNYFGAIKLWVDIQNNKTNYIDNSLIISIVDLHAITVPHNAKLLNDYIYKCAATLIACGIDPDKTILYQQSDVSYHGQLAWILSTKITMPQLGHMHQFKFKSDGLAEIPLGLYTYPVLQSADILLYKTTRVPVGEDQQQHIELCRDIAKKFNKYYGVEYFPIPSTMATDLKRLKSLRDPLKKMSKSDQDTNSFIQLTDPEEIVMNKIRLAVTDSISQITYDPINRPGVATLIDIDSACTGLDPAEITGACKEMNTGQYKKEVAGRLSEHLKPVQKKYLELISDKAYLRSLLDKGASKANEIAGRKYKDICGIVGMR
jgi:tryptophanyl-tRNA synthetase